MIGWLAGSNSFEIPFKSIFEANIQYLKIGLWETTSYSLVCALTLTKSLLISDAFPAKKWKQVRSFKEIALNKREKIILFLGLISLIFAAVIETNSLVL